ncbi:MAG: hypothetical protein HY532_07820 [Chloroflexi bacterium]|nr:hypothetical protein [Chloroflexota bacterium]
MAIQFNNYSKDLGVTVSGRQYYRWRVFVNEPTVRLQEIQQVEYFLHSSFPEPYQVRTSSEDKFALETSGWGEFTIGITVTFKSGKQEQMKYHLVLDPEQKPWPKEPTATR